MNIRCGSTMSTLRLATPVILVAANALLTACAPICEAAGSWTWGSCFADIHGRDPASVRSELDSLPVAGFEATIEPARASVRNYIVARNIPGLSLAVGIGGKIVWAEGFGWSDIEEQRPVTPRIRFRIGGVAEPMTAVAVGLLMERGALDIDRPAQEYVPDFPEQPWPITTRQLMSHTADMRHYDDDEMLYRNMSCTSPIDALLLYADDMPRFEPGTAAQYSGYGFTLVAAIVQAAAGEPFLSFMQREVLDPLGMDDTSIDAAGRYGNETSRFYWPFAARNTRTGIEYANNPDNSCLQGAAALLSTPTDLVRFGEAIFAGDLLQPATLTTLLTPVELVSGETTGNGLGWFVGAIPSASSSTPARVFHHDGLSAGGTALLLVAPEHRIVLALASNVSYAAGLDSLAYDILQEFVVE
jgi:serine beta-lactamase-like protein LACTB